MTRVTSLFVGVDVGTSGARALLVDQSGRVRAEATSGYSSTTQQPGWSEQQPSDWWRATKTVISIVARYHSHRIAGIGLTGQMHGAVFLDKRNQVIRPAMLWNDQRTTEQCQEITERVGAERLVAITGNPALTGFQAPKVLWLRQHEPSAYERVAHLLLPKDYVRLQLCGDYVTDASDASGTLMMDLQRRNWSTEVLRSLQIPDSWLPRILEGPSIGGALTKEAAAAVGLRPGIPIAAGAGDNAAAAVGIGAILPGQVGCSIGTSGVVSAHEDEPRRDPRGRIHTFGSAVPGAYQLLGVTLSAGASLRWWRDIVSPRSLGYLALVRQAAQVPVGAENLLFLPYLTGERTPHLDPHARGCFWGLTSRHGRGHMSRAVMEGVCFSLRDCLELMREIDLRPQRVYAIGGGARSDLWCQMQADVFGVPVRRTAREGAATYGAALLAGVAAGNFADVSDACRVIPQEARVFHPDPINVETYNRQYEIYRRLYPAMNSTTDSP